MRLKYSNSQVVKHPPGRPIKARATLSVVLLGLFLAGCKSPAPYQTDITSFGQGVIALESANDNLTSALRNQQERDTSQAWMASRPHLKLLNCAETPKLDAASAPLATCVVVTGDQDAAPAESFPLIGLDQSKHYMELVRKYAVALAALTGSTDPGNAAKTIQTIGQSISGVATAVGNNDAAEKGNAIAASGLGQALLSAGSAALANWQYDEMKESVAAANDPIKQISVLVAAAFLDAQTQLLNSIYSDADIHKLHIIDSGWTGPIKPEEYKSELDFVTQTADRINLIRSANLISAAKNLAASHAALNDALQTHASLADVSAAMTSFLDSTQKAQTVLQQASNPIGISSN